MTSCCSKEGRKVRPSIEKEKEKKEKRIKKKKKSSPVHVQTYDLGVSFPPFLAAAK